MQSFTKAKFNYMSPRELSPADDKDVYSQTLGYTSPKIRQNANSEFRGAKKVGKRTGRLNSMNSSVGKFKT